MITVLFKLKPDVSEAQKSELGRGVSNMLGQVPGQSASKLLSSIDEYLRAYLTPVIGLRSIKIGPPHPSTAHRGKGFDMAVVAVLEQAEDIKVYAEHPAHLV